MAYFRPRFAVFRLEAFGLLTLDLPVFELEGFDSLFELPSPPRTAPIFGVLSELILRFDFAVPADFFFVCFERVFFVVFFFFVAVLPLLFCFARPKSSSFLTSPVESSR